MNDKIYLRTTFDQNASLYEEVRPGYPNTLFDDIIKLSKISEDSKILEIGCGTAQATLPFAQRGYAIHCIELGANLAAIAKRKLRAYPKAQVSVGSFEEYQLNEKSFDLVVSATAFHWIDPKVGYQKAADVLKPNGTFALFWNKPVQTIQDGADCFHAIQNVYERVVPDMAKRFTALPRPDAVPTPIKEEINRSMLFGEVTVLKYRWATEYTSQAYVKLLNTYSDHIALEEDIRAELFNDIETLVETDFDGRIVKEYLSIMYLAHRI
jgi:SAM-dependent methyltransferase